MAEITITTGNFQEEVMQSSKPVLLDFWAIWCGPCKMIAPVVEELAEEYEGKLKVGKVNVDDEAQLAAQFGIQSIPTLLVIKDGKTVDSAIGYRPKAQIEDMLKQYI